MGAIKKDSKHSSDNRQADYDLRNIRAKYMI